ncbi:MAG: biotin synthase BioB [Thermodesulfobacteriota bacterium]
MTSFPADIAELRALSCRDLMERALAAKLDRRGTRVSLCSIINAKSGRCSEDCRFCTQSARYPTATPVYSLKDTAEIVAAARQAREDGASHFSIVTSGRGVTPDLLPRLCAIIGAVRAQVDISVCASLGLATLEDFCRLKEAGLSRYHHNLETSREFFPHIVTTHSFSDRINTIRAAQQAGLEVCAGGIIGLGESEDDRVSMALSLAELGVVSVPLNILIPLPGTPLEKTAPLAVEDILRTISLFRLILPDIPLRLAAGRESALADFLGLAFLAGADGMMIGGYLTQRGRSPEQDRRFIDAVRRLWG